MLKSCVALIPARSGSKRIPDKNIKILRGHPLLAYTIQVAFDSKIFERIIVSTDSQKYKGIAQYYGAEVPFLRPSRYATLTSPDIEWVKFTLEKLKKTGSTFDCFCILRPTNPFRSCRMIKNAWRIFLADGKADSLRAIEKCRQHPGKMWIIKSNRIRPVMVNPNKKETPWHSQQYQSLPEIYVQNGSMEIAWTRLPLEKNTISGEKIMPFFTSGYEGYDLNEEKDWIYAEHLLNQKKVELPTICKATFFKS